MGGEPNLFMLTWYTKWQYKELYQELTKIINIKILLPQKYKEFHEFELQPNKHIV